MQSLNVIRLTLEHLEQDKHKLPNYTVINGDSLRELIRQIDENYSYNMPIWFMI